MRSSGVLMHITSLPGPFGIGTMGAQAYAFVDFLKEAGQSWWQILPLSPTGYGDSPYQSASAFAGNPYLIDLEQLEKDGLLQPEDYRSLQWNIREDQVDFGLIYQNRRIVLRKAYARFSGGEAFERFCWENSNWLADYSLFMALKDHFQGAPWYQWEAPLKRRDSDAVWNARQTLADEIRFYSFQQFLFFEQWQALKNYAREKGVGIIGDVPIYVPLDSADVWSSPEEFLLDEALQPTAVAGCPPDAFSEDGQLWGNPLYNWKAMAADGYSWWLRRLAFAGKLYDVVRLDHFRAFEAYWSVPYGDVDARGGHWVKGPDMDFVRAVKEGLPGLSLIAEDLGFLTPEVLQLRNRSGFPGMKVLQFAFDSRENSQYLPHNYIANTVCYTGTHDNMTTRQWLENLSPEARAYAVEYMNLAGETDVWGVIRTALSSVSDLCIVPIQDYLELGGEARMNFPGTTTGNWTWRVHDGFCTDVLARRIAGLTRLYYRENSNCGTAV